MKTYKATATREGAWWLIRIHQLDLVTQARRLDQAEAMARELIALWLEVAEDSFGVVITPELDASIQDSLADLAVIRQEAADANLRASAGIRSLVRALVESGYTVRDAGAILDVSPQRISQLNPLLPIAGRRKTTPVGRAGTSTVA